MPHITQNEDSTFIYNNFCFLLQGDCAVFLDVLVCAQHRGNRPDGTCPNAVDCLKFDEIIRVCNRTVFYASPLLQPLALSRAWCLFEIMMTIVHGKKLLVALNESDREGLKRLILNDFDRIVTMFCSIKSENAEATLEEDLWMDTARPRCGWVQKTQ